MRGLLFFAPRAAIAALCLLPSVASAQDVRGRALARAGWEAVRAGRIEDAERAFADAIAKGVRDGDTLLGAGLAADLAGAPDRARDLLERAIEVNPRLLPAYQLLGTIAHRRGNLHEAIAVYDRALTVAPDHAEIRSRLAAWRKELELHGTFRQAVSDHFTVLFEGPAEEALARAALELLETAYWRVCTSLYAYPPSVITVVLYTQEQFRDVTRSPSWSAGAYDGTIRVPMRGALANRRELERVLAHEFTHALVKSLAPQGVPTWLHEGLAALFETGSLAWAERAVERASAAVSLASLHGSFARLDDGQARIAYATSALATRALVDRAGTAAMAALVGDLGRGVPFEEAFEQRMLMPYREFAAAWR